METIEVVVGADDFSAWIMTVRSWLDARGLEPCRFNYNNAQERVVVHVDFRMRGEARAFATQFAGRLCTNA
jgi:hypothetical protein